jgi:hypothetical protein
MSLRKPRGLMAIIRQWQASIAVLLYGVLLFGSIVGAVAQSRQAAEQIALGPAGIVICIASEDGVLDATRHSQSTHHGGECCVLCTINHTVRVHDLAFLPHVLAYEPITSIAELHVVFYPLPDIASSDGVFPHDIPARAPPALTA